MRLAVVGDPVDHSRSPAIQTAALRAAGIAGEYIRLRVDAAGMASVLASIRRGELDGVNVTMPHKSVAATLVDHVAASAGRSGAVNTVTRVGDRLVGHNTDPAGILAAWIAAGLPTVGPVVVLGSGGAAAAALLALAVLDAGPVRLAARSRETGRALVARLGAGVAVETLEAYALTGAVAGAVVVNATPLGMRGEDLPVPIGDASGLFDMPYRDSPTPAVTAAGAAGVPVADGLSMLVHQAAESFRLWTGRAADIDVMTAAATPTQHGGEA